uniref:Transmembrane protein n=1 Tax=Octactis speculum TaxID=3111310 RepID=A0A7S2DDT9_9STRA|mmetsp:Transcript_46451/g.63262  ORF Transcript_46451/g.63262 Transcript_46451/m.63262 type:complete len:110 (+) Transcript_46451:50-379(+)
MRRLFTLSAFLLIFSSHHTSAAPSYVFSGRARPKAGEEEINLDADGNPRKTVTRGQVFNDKIKRVWNKNPFQVLMPILGGAALAVILQFVIARSSSKSSSSEIEKKKSD